MFKYQQQCMIFSGKEAKVEKEQGLFRCPFFAVEGYIFSSKKAVWSLEEKPAFFSSKQSVVFNHGFEKIEGSNVGMQHWMQTLNMLVLFVSRNLVSTVKLYIQTDNDMFCNKLYGEV